MKEIEFEEGQLNNLHEIAMQLFQDTSDPRSYAYPRTLERPRICWPAILANCLIPVVVAVLCCVGLIALSVDLWIAVVAAILALIGYVFLRMKSILICIIRIYQRYAPESVRRKCRYEPSCSQYMILSIQKYGWMRGLSRGIGRLKRCDIQHGGFDLP